MAIVVNPVEDEKHALAAAQKRGYLVYNGRHDGKSPDVARAYFDLCRKESKPCVRVGIKGRHATIDVLHTQGRCGFPPAIEEVIRLMGKHETGVTWGWGDVCTSGCILFDVPAERAETLASVLHWLATDPRCDYSNNRN